MLSLKKFPLKRLEEEWKKFENDNSSISPFQYYDFVKIVSKHYLFFSVSNKEFPVFFKIIENDKTIMIVPLCKRFSKEEVCYTTFGATPTIAYQDLIYDNSMSIDKMVDCLKLLNNNLKKIKFYNIPEGSLTIEGIKRLGISVSKEHVNITIPVSNTYEEYNQRLSKSTRQNIRTAYNRLKTDDLEYKIKVITGGGIEKEELNQLMDKYIERRKARYRSTSVIHEWFLRHEHFNTIALSKLKNSIYVILYINNEVAGFWGGYISHNKKNVIVPRLAIDGNFKRYSPGVILINETIKMFCEENKEQFDLSKGDDNYKLTMGGEKYMSYDFVLETSYEKSSIN